MLILIVRTKDNKTLVKISKGKKEKIIDTNNDCLSNQSEKKKNSVNKIATLANYISYDDKLITRSCFLDESNYPAR